MRVRFAPSPTGGLHIGGLRTALFNYLFAKKQGGKFILRIEDTDKTRFVPEAEQYIEDCLAWIGIKPDESPSVGGPYGPYRQSERKALYMRYAQQLLDDNKAYYAFDTKEEIDKMREDLEADGVVKPQYNATSRLRMNNSLTWDKDKVKAHIRSGKSYVIRLLVPAKGEIGYEDMIRGKIKVENSQIDDKILLKSDGMPTYHLANVVDDHLMKITHVIRGEEWLPSAPLHCMLYQAFGWESSRPQFAHMPLILKPTGQGKLSKRDADKGGFPIFPLTWDQEGMSSPSIGFKEKGYLPEAIINFLSLLGWNPGNEKELFSIQELIASFSMSRIVKSGARFDLEKAKWFNQQYIKKMPIEELAKPLDKQYPNHPFNHKTAKLFAERITFPTELVEASRYLYEAPTTFDPKVAKKRWTKTVVVFLEKLSESLDVQKENTRSAMESLMNDTAQSFGIGIGKVMQGVRLALTGVGGGPDLMEIMTLLGKDEVKSRIAHAINILGEGK